MLLGTVFGIALGGIEVLLVFILRGPYSRGISWPVSLLAIVAAVLWVAAYAGVPFEIVKRRGRVAGIDFGFLTLDFLGAVFSLLSLGTCLRNQPGHISRGGEKWILCSFLLEWETLTSLFFFFFPDSSISAGIRYPRWSHVFCTVSVPLPLSPFEAARFWKRTVRKLDQVLKTNTSI